jgi:hypothetical protein
MLTTQFVKYDSETWARYETKEQEEGERQKGQI